MTEKSDRRELERRLEQARRMAETTMTRSPKSGWQS
jgi:hypothetical protein